ncbi:MAG: hypothetical protein SPL79_03070 [Sphaerochaetaceae bacterium]|nr:hypothetical protein [Sphaerochaetaceae bacterium]
MTAHQLSATKKAVTIAALTISRRVVWYFIANKYTAKPVLCHYEERFT